MHVDDVGDKTRTTVTVVDIGLEVRVLVFNVTFNNISVISWGLGFWCLMSLLTIFLLYRGG